MWLIGLTISLFSIIKTKALECVSIVNQKCMPRPKILDVNEGVGETLFYPYNVQVNKCSGSCNTLDNPMAKLCVPNVIKGVNMQVYNFLTILNETRNVLWHESCKCVCKLNSSICNNKQTWNSDTCRCDCNEDFAGIISCAKGYTWNPSICECHCDKWCKSGQYLDHKNCVCKNKLIRRLIEECTSVINETMINNKDSSNNNTLRNVFIGLFSVAVLIGIICFCVFTYFRWFNINFFYYLWNTIINKIKYLRGDDMMFADNEVIIKDWNKIRFSSDIFIPNDVSINFYSLVIVINYVTEKNDEFIVKIYINEGYFTKV